MFVGCYHLFQHAIELASRRPSVGASSEACATKRRQAEFAAQHTGQTGQDAIPRSPSKQMCRVTPKSISPFTQVISAFCLGVQ
jgi:hypothetical protein